MNDNLQKYALIAEVISSAAVLVTLVILVFEVRTNTQAIQLQAAELSAASFLMPMINTDELPSLYAKVKEVDGLTDQSQMALMSYYDMTVEEAVQWSRFMALNWNVLEYQFAANGPSDALNARVRGFLNAIDLRMHFDNTPPRLMSSEFREYVESIIPETEGNE